MYYYVDGYNLLFRCGFSTDRLREAREELIADLAKQVSALDLEVTLIFDSAYQVGMASRGHKQRLEIIYTSTGETADAFILHELQGSRENQKKIVVTSDRALAEQARRLGAKTMGVEAFFRWLNARTKNIHRQLKTKKVVPKETGMIKPVQARPRLTEEQVYLDVFERRFQEISKDLEKVPRKRCSRKIQVSKQEPESEMARWERLFEERQSGAENI